MRKISDPENGMQYNEALRMAAALCSKAEYCAADISEKLQRRGVSAEDMEKVIAYLCDNRYINHERFARSFVSDKFRFNKWGRVKIRYALKMKKIEPAYIEDALSAVDEGDYITALNAAFEEKLKKRGDISDSKTRASVYNFCVMRGFEPEIVLKVMHSYEKRG